MEYGKGERRALFIRHAVSADGSVPADTSRVNGPKKSFSTVLSVPPRICHEATRYLIFIGKMAL
jgi:hypothetical protein